MTGAGRRGTLARRDVTILLGALAAMLACGDAQASGSVTLADAFPDRARYDPGAPVTLEVHLAAGGMGYEGPLDLRIDHLSDVVHQDSRTISLAPGATDIERFVWTPPSDDFTGYLAVVTAGGGQRTTGIDVSSSAYRFPRYGYLSEFSSSVGSEARATRVRDLAQRYLVDMLQFYDWQWRHEKPIEDEGAGVASSWSDLLGREVLWQAVEDDVAAAHGAGVAALAYVMIYAAREGYAERLPISPAWGIFADPQARNQLDVQLGPGTFLFLFDPSNPGWQDWIIPQYVDAIRRGGFDGVHVDQLGPRYDVFRADGSLLDLPGTFPGFLREAKRRLVAADPGRNACVFNLVDGAVGGWAVQEVAAAHPCDVLYSEIWFSANTYRDLRLYVEQLRQLGNGQAAVIAGYSQYGQDVGPLYEAEDAALQGDEAATDHPGYTGTGFVAGFDAPGDRITWEVNLPEDETVTLAFRYANATGQTATRHLLVDGREAARLTFPSHDLWSSWYSDPYFQVALPAGTHEVALAYAQDDAAAINVDHLRLSTFSESGVRLTDAVAFASGATHIELGDDEQSLAHEYYPNRSKSLTPELKDALRRYYSFSAAYENVLFGADVLPLRDTVASLSIPSGQPVSETGAGVIHPIARRRPGMDILHLVNLIGVEDDLWRNAATAPEPQQDVRVRWRLPRGSVVDSAFWASPDVDGGAPHALDVTNGKDADGAFVETSLPRLEYWDMIVLRTRPG